MLTLFTGKPGAGKTLSALEYLAKVCAERLKGADTDLPPVYIHNVNGIDVTHEDIAEYNWEVLDDITNWMELPNGSIVFVDEAQTVFRKNPNMSRLPEYQTQLEVHRHFGIDFIFTTQGPHLLDRHIHPLIDRHIHLHSTGQGKKWAMRYEWPELKANPRSETSKSAAQIVHKWLHPRHVYNWYRSAEIHNKRRVVPWTLIMKLIFPTVLVALSVIAFSYVDFGYFTGEEQAAAITGSDVGPMSDVTNASVQSTSVRDRADSADWTTQMSEQVAGLPWTSPAYVAAMDITDYPRPQCLVLEDRQECRCYSQQATRLTTITDVVCRHIVENGWYDPGRPRGGYSVNRSEPEPLPGARLRDRHTAPASDRGSGRYVERDLSDFRPVWSSGVDK